MNQETLTSCSDPGASNIVTLAESDQSKDVLFFPLHFCKDVLTSTTLIMIYEKIQPIYEGV